MDFKTYAPVIIPTLNRHEHFKRCLESLERCTGAEYTEVYVALDYPPSEKYKEGWQAIDKFLSEKEQCNRFAKLTVIRRERNYGICHENGNYETLVRDISREYDSYIFTEDDNEFSPNFLEFINWGLQKYKDDRNIIAVCGYNEIPITGCNHNIFVDTWFSAWGVGLWVDKWTKLGKLVKNETYSREVLKSFPLSTIFRREIWLASTLVSSIETGTYYGDSVPDRFREYPLYSIHPTVSMVRNWGQEGSGQHGVDCNRHEIQMRMPIQTEFSFVPSTQDVMSEANLLGLSDRYFKIPIRNRIYESINFLSFKLTGRSATWLLVFYKKYIKKWLKKH